MRLLLSVGWSPRLVTHVPVQYGWKLLRVGVAETMRNPSAVGLAIVVVLEAAFVDENDLSSSRTKTRMGLALELTVSCAFKLAWPPMPQPFALFSDLFASGCSMVVGRSFAVLDQCVRGRERRARTVIA